MRVTDGVSKLNKRHTRIYLGDGRKRARVSTVRHRYGRRGVFRVVVRARDRAGNRVTFRRRVRIP